MGAAAGPVSGIERGDKIKITDIKTYLVEAHRRNWVFIEVETDEGITGIGEATIEPFERTMVTLIEDYKRTVIGHDPPPHRVAVGRPLSRPVPALGPIG